MADQPDKLRMATEFDVAEPQPEPPKPAEPQKFVREIDLGDGGGKQHFEADSYEALCDKLTTAQEHATRKIRELSRETKRREPERQSSDWQELRPTVLKAEDVVQLQNNPHEMFRRMYQSEFGVTPEEARAKENERRRQEAEIAAQNEFVRKHQDYSPTPQNAEKVMRFLQQQNLPVSRRNLDYAFEELRNELAPQATPSTPGLTEPREPARSQPQISSPPSFIRPSLGARAMEETSGGNDAAEIGRIAQLPPAEMKARIEQIFRQSRSR
jgi:hypothetical protein